MCLRLWLGYVQAGEGAAVARSVRLQRYVVGHAPRRNVPPSLPRLDPTHREQVCRPRVDRMLNRAGPVLSSCLPCAGRVVSAHTVHAYHTPTSYRPRATPCRHVLTQR